MSLLPSFFHSISWGQESKGLLVLDEFPHYPTLRTTCRIRKGWLGSWVLMSLVIGTLVPLPAKCPKTEHSCLSLWHWWLRRWVLLAHGVRERSWRSPWPLLLGPPPPCPWSSDLHFHVNEPREESVSEFCWSFILFFSLKNWTRNSNPFSPLPFPGAPLVHITTNRTEGPANSRSGTGRCCLWGLMRSPECKQGPNTHWKYSVPSLPSLSCPSPSQGPEPSASWRWPAKLIPLVAWGKALKWEPEAHSELISSLRSSCQSRGWNVGANGNGNRVHMAKQNEKSGGQGAGSHT